MISKKALEDTTELITEIREFIHEYKIYFNGIGLYQGDDSEDDLRLETILLLADKLKNLKKSRLTSASPSSYSLKNIVEYGVLIDGYVSNGEFIVSAAVAGFTIKRIPNSRNVLVNLSKSEYTRLFKMRYPQ